MTVTNPVSSELLPPPPNSNGAATVPPGVIQQVAQAADVEAERKLAAIAQLGRAIRHRERDRDKQATAVAEKESELKTERTALHKIEHEIEDLHDELTTLATGKQSERLPFKDPGHAEAPPVDPNKSAEQALQDAFDALPLSEIGVKSNLADKLVADGIRYGRELRDWVQNHVRRDIKGVGPKSIENLGELMAVKMLAMQAQAKEAKAEQPVNPETLDAMEKLTNIIGGDIESVTLSAGGKSVTLGPEAKRNVRRMKARANGPAAETFDDSEIKADSREFLVNVAELVGIEVAQRNGGRWAHKCSWQYGESATALTWRGDFATREEAAVAAADLINEALPKKGLKGGSAKKATAIRRELDALDKRLAKEAKADVPAKVKKQLARGAAKYGNGGR